MFEAFNPVFILAALKDRDIAARGKGNNDGIDENEILQMLQTMIKERNASIEMDEKGAGTYEDVIEGIQYVVENKYSYNVRVINLSLSAYVTTPYFVDPFNRAVEAAWANDIVVVADALSGIMLTSTAVLVAVSAPYSFATMDYHRDNLITFTVLSSLLARSGQITGDSGEASVP